MTFADLSRVLARRWKWLIGALVLGAALGYGAGKTMTPGYSATAVVVLRSATDDGAQSLLERAPSYAQLVTARRVLAPVEAQLGVKLADKVSGTYGDGTLLVLISASDTDKTRVAKIADGVAASYADQLSRGFGGAVPGFLQVNAQVVERADNVSAAGKLSPKLLGAAGAVGLPLLALAFFVTVARRGKKRGVRATGEVQ